VTVEHWELFYRGGALAACPTGPDPNYTLDVRDAWVEFFASLADGARLLDIGTGNGAVALIARETALAAGRRFEIHGSDLALIDPPRQVRGGAAIFDGITFHGGIPTERLPFEESSFDAVSGQFALEYTRVADALREIFRVLKPGGRARFSVHHADSVVVRNAGLSLAQSNLVLEETRIFRRLRAFVEAERNALAQPRARAKAAEAQAALNQCASQLRQVVATTVNAHTLRVTLDAVQQLLSARHRWSAAELDREITRVEREVRASARRLQDLVSAAMPETAIRRVVDTAAGFGFETSEPRPQFQSGETLVAWLIDLRRPDASVVSIAAG